MENRIVLWTHTPWATHGKPEERNAWNSTASQKDRPTALSWAGCFYPTNELWLQLAEIWAG